MLKNQSAIIFNNSSNRLLTESTSLKPFPKLDPEFYEEKNNNYFWQKEMTKIKSEKSIFSNKIALKKTGVDSNSKIFYDVKFN